MEEVKVYYKYTNGYVWQCIWVKQCKGYFMFLHRKQVRITTMKLSSVIPERGITELSTISLFTSRPLIWQMNTLWL